MPRLVAVFIILGVFFLSQTSVGQSDQTIPIVNIFKSLEERFDCTFSYADATLANHRAVLPKATNLPKALSNLTKQTLFNFSLLPNNVVTVSLKDTVRDVCIEIIDKDMAIPLHHALVTTPFQQVQSNEKGQVTYVLPSKTTTVLIQAGGYGESIIKSNAVQSDTCTVVGLSKNVEQLTPVLLQQYVTKGIDKNTDGTIAVNFEDFILLPGLIEKDVLFSLKALPGIQSVNENVSYLNIRGGTNDQNLILWDGIKMYQNGHFFGLISAFNPTMTQEARVTRNGTTAALGDGVSGTVEMFTQTELTKTMKAEAGVNMLSADAFVDIPLGTLASLQVAGRKSLNSIWSSPTYSAYFDKAFQNTEVLQNIEGEDRTATDFSFYDASFRVLLQPSENDFLRVNFTSFSNDISFAEMFAGDATQRPLSLNSSLSQRTIASGLFYERTWTDRLSSSVQVYGNSYELQSVNGDLQNNQTLIQENHIEEGSIATQIDYKVGKQLNVSTGIQFIETGITNLQQLDNPAFFREEKKVMRNSNAFTTLQFSSKDRKTNFEAGLRANYYDKFNILRWEPRLRFSQRFLSYFTFELLGELKSQNTTQVIDLQKDFLGVENRRWVLSEPGTIPLLTSKQLSAGISFNRNGYLLNIEPYVKNVTGITTQSQGFQNQFESANAVGEYLVKGVDVLLNKKFKELTTWLSYSYADNRYTFETLSPSVFHNNLDITHTLTGGINYTWNQFNFATGVNWHSGKPFTPPETNSPITNGGINFEFPNSGRIKDYVRVDFSMLYNFKIRKGIRALAGLSLWNVLNRENRIRTFFTTTEEDTLQRIDDTALPFTPNATFRIFF